jgi:hypothetical protein
MRAHGSWVLAAVLGLSACGGSSDSGLSAVGGSAGSGGGSGGGNAGTAGAAGTTSYTLANVCEKTAPIGCELDKPCCLASGFGYDHAGCVARAIAECEQYVAEVQAGTMQFDPGPIDACIAAFEPYLQKCFLNADDLFPIFDALEPCTKIWKGSRPEGAACDWDAQCAQSNDPNVYVACDDTSAVCRHFAKLGIDAACELSESAPGACGPGLYCDAFLGAGPPYQGVCKQATVPGQNCNTFKPYNLECGLGFYCDAASGVCTSAKAGGAACVETLECQTLTCTLGECSAQKPLVTQAICTG